MIRATTRCEAATSSSVRAKSGASLVEVMMAILIMGLCVAGFFAIVVRVWGMSQQARSHYAAVNVAKNRIERARAADFGLLDTFVENPTRVDVGGMACATGELRRTTSLTNISPQLVEMTVRVEIQNQGSRAFTGENETLTARLARFQELNR